MLASLLVFLLIEAKKQHSLCFIRKQKLCRSFITSPLNFLYWNLLPNQHECADLARTPAPDNPKMPITVPMKTSPWSAHWHKRCHSATADNERTHLKFLLYDGSQK